jgi:hypothetical protein
MKSLLACVPVARSAVWDVELKMPSGRCELQSTGKVSCVPSTVYYTLCNPDLTYWPNDQVNCSLRLGAWMQYGDEINLTTEQQNVSSVNIYTVKSLLAKTCILGNFKFRIILHFCHLLYQHKRKHKYANKCSILSIFLTLLLAIRIT